ncbi:neuroglian isoform X1 [Octopus sinensis]|uniref:Neuroglian isoform X1 n=1 Tax=Octopus sinensis TaxID=2607531 RepID=A0A6P7S854_9MOLL|nr:neuroglian isoform X1 [Octopus sinensis]
MKIAVLLATSFIFLLTVHHVSAQWDASPTERESPFIEDTFPDKTFFVNQKLTEYWQINYPCEVSKGIPKPEIYWKWYSNGVYKGKIDSKSGDRVLNGTRLALKNINPDERYRCVAENIYGTALSKKIHILQSKTTKFNINEKVEDTITKNAGETLVIKCKFISPGQPVGLYYWKTKNRITETDRIYTNVEGSLVFSYVESDDTNTYTCNNMNPKQVATTGGGWTNLTVNPNTLPVEAPLQKLYTTENNSIAMFGREFLIQCMYGGIPIPRIRWETPLSMRPNNPEHTLVIKTVTENHGGCYTCKASSGNNRDETKICIHVAGPPIWVNEPDPEMTVAEESNVVFHCKARSLKGGKELARPIWMKNGRNLSDISVYPGGEMRNRLSLSLDGSSLTFSDVRKSTDICNFQCIYSNRYGEIFAGISFNVILRTEILVAPESQVISRGDVAVFPIKFKVDPLVKSKTDLTWKLNGNKIETFDIADVQILPNWTLIVNTSQMDEDRFKAFLGNYSITIDNSVETVIKYALLKQNPATGGTTMQSAGLDAKWIALIVALVLFFIIFILLLCILFNRQSGDNYSVDKKERKAGHDPEKELADSGFHDLPRTDDDPGLKKPDNLSISSTGKSIASDTDSMGEYSDNDAGSRFNEDGSFIGAYQSHESKGNESNV